MKDDKQKLIQSLSALVKEYVGAPPQDRMFYQILESLKVIYKTDKTNFEKTDVDLINKLKMEMQKKEKLWLFSSRLREGINTYFLREGTIVFHKTKFFIGVIDFVKTKSNLYRIILLDQRIEFASSEDLENISQDYYQKVKMPSEESPKYMGSAWNSKCWSCKRLLGASYNSTKCEDCKKYICSSCKECYCGAPQRVRLRNKA